MTREEALKAIECAKERAEVVREQGQSEYWVQEINWTIEAIDMAIEALQKPPISQRSMYQAGYRQGREEALKREPSDDGTLEVKVEDATKVGRVLISDDEHRGGLYYPDEDEPQKKYPTEWCEQCTLWEDNKCIGVAQCKSNIEALKHVMSEDLISRQDAIKAARHAWSKDLHPAQFIEALPSANIQKWTPCAERMPDDGKWAIWCSNEGVIGIARYKEDGYFKYFYPNDASFELEDAAAWMPLPEPYKESDAK